MSNALGDRLFSTRHLIQVTHNLTQKVLEEINEYDADHILNVNSDELLSYLLEKYALVVPQLHEDQITTSKGDARIHLKTPVGEQGG
jgi:hypothetical protein